MMTPRSYPLLIVAFVLIIFFPAFFGEICKVDDAGMVRDLQNAGPWSLRGLFLPGNAGGLYYRPLLMLSLMIDKTLFGLSAFPLHAGNILLHLANTLLVFAILRQLATLGAAAASPAVALAGSLLFGFHPLVTESVNWISGRTDLLMGFFLLSSIWLLVRYRVTGGKYLPWLAAMAWLAALLSKEVAIAFLPGYFLLLFAKSPADEGGTNSSARLWKNLFLLGAAALVAFGLFFLLRHFAFSSNSSRIGLTLQYMQINPSHSFWLFLRAIGFYFKKLLLPWPLSFAIVEVDPLYELLAIPLLGLCGYLVWQRTIVTGMFAAGVLLFTPALLIALGQIAWTPYAERYLYVPVALVVIAAAAYGSRYVARLGGRWSRGLVVILVGLAAITTLQRNLTWQSNLAILADTARKAPDFERIQWLYGATLYYEGDYEGALFYTQRAAALPGNPLSYEQTSAINLGYIQYRMGNIPAALAAFETVIARTGGKSPEAHEGLLVCYRFLWQETTDPARKREYLQAMQLYGERLFALRPDPLIYYQLGKIALASQEPEAAREFFAAAVARMSAHHPYRLFAQKLLRKLPEG